MGSNAKKLSAILVNKISSPGHYGDGEGLWLQISVSGSKSWVFRFTLSGRAREMGIGSLNAVSLAIAREKARECRLLLSGGKDPIVERDEPDGERVDCRAVQNFLPVCCSVHRGASGELKKRQACCTVENVAGNLGVPGVRRAAGG